MRRELDVSDDVAELRLGSPGHPASLATNDAPGSESVQERAGMLAEIDIEPDPAPTGDGMLHHGMHRGRLVG